MPPCPSANESPEFLDELERMFQESKGFGNASLKLDASIPLARTDLGQCPQDEVDSPAVDLTIRRWRALEALRIQMRRIEAIRNQTRGTVHEFNNILTTIICHVELLLSDPGLQGPLAKEIDAVRGEVRRAISLSGQLSAMCHMPAGQLRLLDLSVFICAMGEKIRGITGSPRSLSLATDPLAGIVLADPASLEQVVLGLARLVCEGLRGNDRLDVETRRQARPPRASSDTDIEERAVLVLRPLRQEASAGETPSDARDALPRLQALADPIGARIDVECVLPHGWGCRLSLPSFSTPATQRR